MAGACRVAGWPVPACRLGRGDVEEVLGRPGAAQRRPGAPGFPPTSLSHPGPPGTPGATRIGQNKK